MFTTRGWRMVTIQRMILTQKGKTGVNYSQIQQICKGHHILYAEFVSRQKG